jgi:NAD(P)-dependent dehydrogenase (short-subunit alcohol dehydrogenase family)
MGTSDLTGRAALVTGGSRGLGGAIARALCDAGARVAVAARSADELERYAIDAGAAGHTVTTLTTDLRERGEADRLLTEATAALGGIDILVHAAGHLVRRPAVDLDMRDWDELLAVHLRTAFELARGVARELISQRKPGSIVFLGSLTSARAGISETSAYAAAKSGLLGLMRTLAVEWGPHGIRVNTLAVGFVPTALTSDVQDTPARRRLHARIPLGRTGTPADVAAAALFLASDSAAYISGETLSVDGGWSVA